MSASTLLCDSRDSLRPSSTMGFQPPQSQTYSTQSSRQGQADQATPDSLSEGDFKNPPASLSSKKKNSSKLRYAASSLAEVLLTAANEPTPKVNRADPAPAFAPPAPPAPVRVPVMHYESPISAAKKGQERPKSAGALLTSTPQNPNKSVLLPPALAVVDDHSTNSWVLSQKPSPMSDLSSKPSRQPSLAGVVGSTL
eukprot:m.93141 g.93141  ORF g.93141 m.93141 type:complete len:197 (-) comp51192_c0_seq4:154-744(-)